MNPAADVHQEKGLSIDLSQITEGEQIKVLWKRKPVFIRHRTPSEIEAAVNVAPEDLLYPETDGERLKPLPDGNYNPKYLIIYGVCPHFGCVPVGEAGDFDGWYCPCHGSSFRYIWLNTQRATSKKYGCSALSLPLRHCGRNWL